VSYNIKTVADMLDISRNTLIAWERRYAVVVPERTANGYRVYSDEEVQTLKDLKALLDKGHRVGEAIRLLQSQPKEETSTPSDDLRSKQLSALLRFDRSTAESLQQRLGVFSFEQTIEGVYMPSLREIGMRWESGEISVAQEHYASAFYREQMAAMLHSLSFGSANGKRVMCAGLPEEHHELGLLATAIKLALRGFHVDYFGLDLPFDDLVSIANANPPEAICQSVVLARDPRTLRAYAEKLRANVPRSTALIFGGRGAEPLADMHDKGITLCRSFAEVFRALAN